MPQLRTSVLVTAVAGVVLALSLALATPATPAATSSTVDAADSSYTVDPVHSSVVFRIRHMKVANFMGRFNTIGGTYQYDPENPGAASFNISIETASVDSNNERRDNHLRSPDFFNVREYPSITFKSTSVEPLGTSKLRVTGDLSLHGVTKPITAELDLVGIGETPQGFKTGFDATFTVKRSEYGMDTYIASGGLGDEVTIMLSLEGGRG